MTTRSPVFWHVVLTLSIGLFVTGCASFSGTAPRAVVTQSYDLPGALEANAVIRAVERAFTETLSKPPRIVEGSVPSPLPTMPAQFRVEERLMHLDRLGMVRIPEVVCPESMAIVQALVADRSALSGPHSVIGCIQLYAGGYRVSLVDSRMVVESHDAVAGPMDSEPKSNPGLLARIAGALRDQISESRLVADSHARESDASVWRTDAKSSASLKPTTGEPVMSLDSPPERSVATHSEYREKDVASVLPLVCLAPRYESAPVRAARGEGHVLTMLDSGSTMAVAEPVDATYFRVETEDGMAGWVNRSDVKRLPCPIG